MTDNTNLPTFEAVITYIPKEKAVIRLPAESAEAAAEAIKAMATEYVTDLQIVSCEEIAEEEPIPEGYESEGNVVALPTPDKKLVH